jgi:hypothetical protein
MWPHTEYFKSGRPDADKASADSKIKAHRMTLWTSGKQL